VAHVSIERLRKTYGSFTAVKDLDLEVRQGELIALLGPSGCGKTTTLRIVAGFITATSGRVAFDGRNVTALPSHKRNCGMVFQNYALFPHLDVFHNVAYGLEMRRVPPSEIKARVGEALARVHLSEFGSRYPRQLSGGQQQRVALARAIVIKPAVLLLDEPLSNLDAKLRVSVRNEIRSLQQEAGLTTIFVTHDQEEAVSIADRLVVMNKGTVEQIGGPREIYDHPRTRFVADFIGRCNLLEGRREGSSFVTASGTRFAVSVPDQVSQAVTALAIRPERIKCATADDPGPNKLQGTIETVSFIGPYTEFSVRTADGPILVHLPSHDRTDSELFAAGQTVTLAIRPEACRLL
jgi:putative spermidine/putrescine transport system ATP-binding protein